MPQTRHTCCHSLLSLISREQNGVCPQSLSLYKLSLLFRYINKSPLLAVEVDGTAFHATGSVQTSRDEKKNRIFEKCGIQLLRLRTDGSGEKERIEQGLRASISIGQ